MLWPNKAISVLFFIAVLDFFFSTSFSVTAFCSFLLSMCVSFSNCFVFVVAVFFYSSPHSAWFDSWSFLEYGQRKPSLKQCSTSFMLDILKWSSNKHSTKYIKNSWNRFCFSQKNVESLRSIIWVEMRFYRKNSVEPNRKHAKTKII